MESPVYAMSLGSKELFHSNFWAWLIESDYVFATVFFPNIDTSSIIAVGREDKNKDITIYMKNNSCYVIENKIKSIPTNNQLNNYRENTTNFEKGVLTGIKETLNIDDKNYWSFLSYKDISNRIRKIQSSSSNVIIIKNSKLIVEYCDILDFLTDVVIERLEQTSNLLDFNSGYLNKIRFDDVYKKFKADDYIKKYLRNSQELLDIVPNGFELKTEPYFSDKNAIIDIRFVIKDKMVIGVQIQGNQFRLVAERSIPNKCKEVFNEFLGYGWFDPSFDKRENKTIKGKPTSMTSTKGKIYNKYETSYYSFVYQYFDLDDDTRVYDKLYQLIIKYMKEASEIAKKIEV